MMTSYQDELAMLEADAREMGEEEDRELHRKAEAFDGLVEALELNAGRLEDMGAQTHAGSQPPREQLMARYMIGIARDLRAALAAARGEGEASA